MQYANPLFPGQDNDPSDSGYMSLRAADSVPAAKSEGQSAGADAAITLIREKLAHIYAEEPDAKAEEKKAEAAPHRSKHQAFMYQLHASGRSLAEIQTAWHDYYAALPDHEKHEVWQEFYQANERIRQQHAAAPAPVVPAAPQPTHILPATSSRAYAQHGQLPAPVVPMSKPAPSQIDLRSARELRTTIRDKVSAGGKLKLRHHLQSLSFGLAIGFITLVITLFGFFNEVIIAPFIQPSRTVSATPIIIDPSAVTASSTPEIIIPKINLEIPVDYSAPSDNENDIQNALLSGIVHYPSTVAPGQNGNAAFFGHSSNNILNPGKYKFAFVLLHELVPGDTFYITYNGKIYIYKVFQRQVVDPSDIGVLSNIDGHPATATLITCDPPGTALRRLVVVGDQISPDPTTNGGGTNTTSAATANTTIQLPDNGPTLWQRVWSTIF